MQSIILIIPVLKEPSIRTFEHSSSLNLSSENFHASLYTHIYIYIYIYIYIAYLWIVVIKELLISSLKLCRHLSPGDKRANPFVSSFDVVGIRSSEKEKRKREGNREKQREREREREKVISSTCLRVVRYARQFFKEPRNVFQTNDLVRCQEEVKT